MRFECFLATVLPHKNGQPDWGTRATARLPFPFLRVPLCFCVENSCIVSVERRPPPTGLSGADGQFGTIEKLAVG